jgi:DnaK suppressor protein
MKTKTHDAFRLRLIQMEDDLRRELEQTEEALREDVHKPGELSNVPTHPADHDVEGIDREIALAHNEEHLLRDVVAALRRIDAGTYGVCQACGRDIGHERLEAIPYTPWCVECANERDGQEDDEDE